VVLASSVFCYFLSGHFETRVESSSTMNSSVLFFMCSLIIVFGQLEQTFGLLSESIVEAEVNLNGRHLSVCVSYVSSLHTITIEKIELIRNKLKSQLSKFFTRFLEYLKL